jgi:hypothetical protein
VATTEEIGEVAPFAALADADRERLARGAADRGAWGGGPCQDPSAHRHRHRRISPMTPIIAYTIRLAAGADRCAVEQLAALDGRRPLPGEVLVAEKDGDVVAALSLEDRRVAADPFRRTADARALLEARAASLHAVQHAPRLRERLRAAVRGLGARWAEAA